jgi:integrase
MPAKERIRLTEARVRDVPTPPAGGRTTVYDLDSPLMLRVTPSGSRAWYVRRRINGEPKRVRLAAWPETSVEQARRLASATVGEIAAGRDPVADRRQRQAEASAAAYTFEDAFTDYLDLGGKQGGKRTRGRKPSTEREYRRLVDRHIPKWKSKVLAGITGDDVVRVYRKVGKSNGEATANALMRPVRAVFRFALKRGRIPSNPVDALAGDWYEDHERDNVIPPDQLPAWWAEVERLRWLNVPPAHAVHCDLAAFILLTGLRRGEASSLPWSAVKDEVITIAETKNERALKLPVTPAVAAILERRKEAAGRSPHVFPSPGKKGGHVVELRYMLAKLATVGIEHSVHDMRRTFASVAAPLIPGPVLKAIMNHKARKGGDVTQRHYVRLDANQLRPHLDAVHRELMGEFYPDSSKKRRDAADLSDETDVSKGQSPPRG